MQDNEIIDYIILGLFRDNEFHCLVERTAKEFYIDILDELLANDIEMGYLINNFPESVSAKKGIKDANDLKPEEKVVLENWNAKLAKDELGNLTKEFRRIFFPIFIRVGKKLKELEKKEWLKIKKIDLGVFEKAWADKALYKGKIHPEGKLLTQIIKINAEEINWGKFIEYVTDEYEKVKLDWDNIYSPTKQASLLIQKINERSKFLDKDADIIFLLDKNNSDLGRIQILKTLVELEEKDLIHIAGFTIHELRDRIEKIMYQVANIKDIRFILKAKISITTKFKELVKEIHRETTKYSEIKAETKNKNPHISMSKHITNLTIVRPKSGNKFSVIVNNNYDYKKILKVSRVKPSWNLLFDMAETSEEGVWNEESKYKNCLDYFNTNKRNRLYTQTGYKLTKILQSEDEFIKPAPNIKIDIISERQFKMRLNKKM